MFYREVLDSLSADQNQLVQLDEDIIAILNNQALTDHQLKIGMRKATHLSIQLLSKLESLSSARLAYRLSLCMVHRRAFCYH